MNGKELLEIAEVKQLNIKDGDILAVYCPREPNEEEMGYMTERLKAITGLDVKVLVMPPGYDVSVVRDERVQT